MRWYKKYLAKKFERQKSVRRSIDFYFDEYDVNRAILEITDVKSKFISKKIIITITLCRPGLLIGKQGKDIDKLTAYLSRRFDKEVQIKILESKLWR